MRLDAHDEAFFALDLSPETVDFILDLLGGTLVTLWTSATQIGNCFRYRVKSPAMLSTLCQNQQKRLPELRRVTAMLKVDIDLRWEIRIPTKDWGIPKQDEAPAWREIEGEIELLLEEVAP